MAVSLNTKLTSSHKLPHNYLTSDYDAYLRRKTQPALIAGRRIGRVDRVVGREGDRGEVILAGTLVSSGSRAAAAPYRINQLVN